MAKRTISPERVLQELAAIAFARVPDYMDIEGNLKTELKPSQRAAIASVEKSSTGVKVKFYDKMKALELLGKHLGTTVTPGAETEDDPLSKSLAEFAKGLGSDAQ